MLDDWQRWSLDIAMSEDDDGQWSAFEVAEIVSRQNGKGAILEARQLGGLFYLREPLQVYTAHNFKTTFEHFLRIVNLIEGCPDLDRQVFKIRRGAGEQAIELKSGERLRFLARSTGSGRGLTGDVVYLDEAFALTAPMMGALMPTLSAVPNPQIWYSSSAPRKDSEVLHGICSRGRSGKSARLFYAEWCADEGTALDDVDAWYQANPALGVRISEEFVTAELDAMQSMPEEFARERLGIPEQPESTLMVIPLEQWNGLADESSQIADRCVFALDVSPDRRWSTFGVAGRRDDGVIHVEDVQHRPGTKWVVDYARQLFEKNGEPILIEKGGPAGSLAPLLIEAGIEVTEVSTADHTRATGQFIDAALSGGLAHLGQQTLRSAVVGAQLRAHGDAELWSRRSSKMDITPLVAVTLALGGVPESGDAVHDPFVVFA